MRYVFNEMGYEEELTADNMKEAKAEATRMLREQHEQYGGGEEEYTTVWCDATVTEYDDDGEEVDSDRVTATIDPVPPPCVDDAEHEWTSPYEILGGLKENPGVWGHGGGVIINEVCQRCGCGKTMDTWAQRMDTGEQGLDSVTYEPGKYASALAKTEDE